MINLLFTNTIVISHGHTVIVQFSNLDYFIDNFFDNYLKVNMNQMNIFRDLYKCTRPIIFASLYQVNLIICSAVGQLLINWPLHFPLLTVGQPLIIWPLHFPLAVGQLLIVIPFLTCLSSPPALLLLISGRHIFGRVTVSGIIFESVSSYIHRPRFAGREAACFIHIHTASPPTLDLN